MVAPQNKKMVAQFDRLSECNPGAFRYHIAVKTSQRRLAFYKLGGKT
jgi:hypothetical protein